MDKDERDGELQEIDTPSKFVGLPQTKKKESLRCDAFELKCDKQKDMDIHDINCHGDDGD